MVKWNGEGGFKRIESTQPMAPKFRIRALSWISPRAAMVLLALAALIMGSGANSKWGGG